MIFQSLDFLVFLVLVFALHWLLPPRFRNPFLLLASYFFYGYVHPWFLFLLWFVTVVVYGCGLGIERQPQHRKLFLMLGLVGCFGMLGVFKYFNFFAENFIALFQTLGINLSEPTLRILLPVGISFFAFQGASYVIDVYRGDIRARTNFIDVALFKAFFPQLVAGPIERATHLLVQVEQKRELRLDYVVDGLLLIIWGFFKKLVIADNVSIVANKVFLLEQPGFPVLWAGVLAFCVQIFADFSAYTDIARGTGKLFGINLIDNFRHPYLASNPVDFWRRWHISLSSWFRDYVYIPLGGNRAGRFTEARNVMITFLLSGLWHGASWNFVIWGGYWGLLIVLHRNFAHLLPAWWSRTPALAPARILVMFAFTNLGWLMFRETDLHYLVQHLTLRPMDATSLEWQAGIYMSCLVLLYALPLMVHMYLDRLLDKGTSASLVSRSSSLVTQSLTGAALFLGILVLRTANSGDFIYFQF